MTREKATAALNNAVETHINQLFGVLVRGLVTGDGSAQKNFTNGLAAVDEAETIASQIIEKTFVE